jgi:hypothetical protein
VSLSSNGTVLAIGDTLGGAARVYRYDGSAWAEMPGLPPCVKGAAYTMQVSPVSLSWDGTVLAVGGTTGISVGTWVYRYGGSAWVESPGMPLRSSGPRVTSVSLSSDGTVLAAGAPGSGPTDGGTGLWRYDGSAWVESPGTPLLGGSGPAEGMTVSLSSDGSVLAITGPPYNDRGGGTWVYATAVGCGPGTYLASPRLPVECTPAPGGSYALGYTTSYLACPAGSYSSTRGASACQPCRAGTFASATGAESCLSCPPGSFTSTTGAVSCLPCPAGTYSKTPQTCTACPMFQDAAPGSARCTRTGAWYGVFVAVPALCVVVLALVARRRKLAAAWAQLRAWREQARRDRIAGQQLEALLAVHGVKDPDALRAVQVGGWASHVSPHTRTP